MNGKLLILWASLFALLLQCSVAQDLELELEQDQKDATTADMEMATTNLMPTAAAEPHVQTASIDSVTELQTPKPSAMSMETKPADEVTTESMVAQDYQNDAAAPEVDTATEAQKTTAAETPKPTVDKESDSKSDNKSTPGNLRGCFGCESLANGTCVRQPTNRKQCARNSEKTGCYTLFKRETKLIMRGCVSELTAEGHNYCQNEKKLCSICPENYCNKKDAPTSGTAQLLGSLALCIIALLHLV